MKNELSEIAIDFLDYMHQFDFSEFDDLMFLLPQLPLIRIHDGYVLDAFDCGYDYGWEKHLYCRTATAYKCYNPISKVRGMKKGMFEFLSRLSFVSEKMKYHLAYDDTLLIRQRLDEDEAKKIPVVLRYFNIPFTTEGIMQAWLLNNLTEFLPKHRHCCHSRKSFLFETESVRREFPELSNDQDEEKDAAVAKLMNVDLKALLPSVRIHGDNAVIEYAYWSIWRGLVYVVEEVVRTGNSMMFYKSQTKTLVNYTLGIHVCYG